MGRSRSRSGRHPLIRSPEIMEHHQNILLMVADDLGLFLGCYGDKVIQTPNIDRLAAEGVRFTNAFASTASCSGSRSTIYTGLHTHENGQYGLSNARNHFQTFEHIETMPRIFNALGYQTGILGKVHVGPHSVYPWEVFEESDSRDMAWLAGRAEAFFDKAAQTNRAFHLTIGFRDPHRDGTRQGFGNNAREVVASATQTQGYRPEDVPVPEFLTDVPELRIELAEYYRSISRMDYGVGLILDHIRGKGLEKNTMVIFVSDNGAPFINSKTTLYDAGIKLPLIIRHPDVTGGVVNPNMASFIDILPTFMDWAGANTDNSSTAHTGDSPRRRGHSLLPTLPCANILPADEWQSHVFGSHTFHEIQNYWPTRYMRSHRFKYHRNIAWRLDFPFGSDLYGSLSWEGLRNAGQPVVIGQRPLDKYLFRGPEELFDLQSDPLEVRNLAGEDAYQDILKDCRAAVEAWQYKTKDLWLFKDGVSVIATQKHQNSGLKIPDRFEMNLENSGNVAGPHWSPRTEEEKP